MDEQSKYIVFSSLRRNHSMRQFKFFSEEPDSWLASEELLDHADETGSLRERSVVAPQSTKGSYAREEDQASEDAHFCDTSYSMGCLEDIGEVFRKGQQILRMQPFS